ncbi:hypothetical protein [Symmachiella dynata]|uniref:hypothetical protein n=1 Tax=Symmachiella dynata TaxID=2527995 RepID=UPI0030EB2844
MATTTLKPNGDGSGGSWQKNTGSTFYELIDEGIAGADDTTTYVYEGASETSLFVDLEATPSDFVEASAVQVSARIQRTTSKGDSQQLYIQIFESDESTSITDEINFPPTVGFSTVSDSSFAITGTNTKAKWDGAKIRFRSTGTNGLLEVSAVEVILTYTPTVDVPETLGLSNVGLKTLVHRVAHANRTETENLGFSDAVMIGVERMIVVADNLGLGDAFETEMLEEFVESEVAENLGLSDNVILAVNKHEILVSDNLGLGTSAGPPEVDAPVANFDASASCSAIAVDEVNLKHTQVTQDGRLLVLAGHRYRR